jgi:alkylation response protein AidB-like acyl-CoA dehydrogenase
MDFSFSEEQLAIRDTIRELVQDKVAPRAAEIDETAEYPEDIERLVAENGVLAIPFPEAYGGISGSSVTICMGIEEIARACATSSLILAVQALGSYPILIAGTEEQKRRLCPPLAQGAVCAYALSEPGSGSDAAAMKTTARRYGQEYVLQGTKIFCTHGNIAQTLVVFAVTDPDAGSRGITAFVLERERSPWSVLKLEHKMGIRGSPTAMLAFDEVRVPAENRLGDEGYGFKIALQVLDRSRPGIGAQALGIAQGALDYAIGYAKERKQFGQPISAFQGIQFMLADMATQIEAARHLVYLAATKVDTSASDLTKVAAMAKLFASDMAMGVTTDAVQILGGYGYIKDYPVERMMRDAKITQIYEGTNQIQRVVISRHLLR